MSDKVLVYSDIHHGTLIGKVNPQSGLDLRIEDSLAIERQLTEYCLENNIHTVLFCGDRFRSRNPGVWLINLVDDLWIERAKQEIVTVGITGNHDQFRVIGYGSNYSSLWKEIKDIWIAHDVRYPEINELQYCLIPYGKTLQDVDDREIDIIVFHDELKGVKDERGYIGRTGFELKAVRQRCKFFFAGHIHCFMEFQGAGMFVGSPYQMDTLDIGMKKGFVVMDSGSCYCDFIELNTPKIVRLETEDLNSIKEEAVRGNYVYVRVPRKLMKEAGQILEKFGARFFRVDEKVEKGLFVQSFARKVYSNESPESAIKEYVDSRNVGSKAELVTAGLEIWQES